MKKFSFVLVLSSLLFTGCSNSLEELLGTLVGRALSSLFSGSDSGGETGDDDSIWTEEVVIPTNELWYTSIDQMIVEPDYDADFGVSITSNIYEDGKGVITFNGDVLAIPDYAFRANCRIKDVVIPNKVRRIGTEAFAECDCLESVAIPYSVKEIGKDAFLWPVSLKVFRGKYASVDGRCLVVDDTIIAYAYASGTHFTVPNSVKYIPAGTFDGCESLESVYLPNGLKYIGDGAFMRSGLKHITIPDSVISIGDYLFTGCYNLLQFSGKFASSSGRELIYNDVLNSVAFGREIRNYTIPAGVTAVGAELFVGYDLLEIVTIPSTVTHIGSEAFCDCEKLRLVYCKATTPPTGDESVFEYNAPGRKIYVPTRYVETYKNAEFWADYADDILGYNF